MEYVNLNVVLNKKLLVGTVLMMILTVKSGIQVEIAKDVIKGLSFFFLMQLVTKYLQIVLHTMFR